MKLKRFFIYETLEEKGKRLSFWKKWFAWYPVQLQDRTIVWLEIVERSYKTEIMKRGYETDVNGCPVAPGNEYVFTPIYRRI